MTINVPRLRNAVCLVLCLVCRSALACPQCQYEQCIFGACVCLPTTGCVIPPQIDPGKLTEKLKVDPVGALVNPLGVYNPTGIPQPADVVEYAIKNPDQAVALVTDPGRVLYTPVAAAIIAARNAVIANGGQGIPSGIKPFLMHWYTVELIDSVRWTSNWNPLANTLQATQMRFDPSTRAISLINAVVFRDDEAAHDPALWAHEMVHIDQYRKWGVTDFARSWVNNSSTGGPVEAPAYARQSEAENLIASADSSGAGDGDGDWKFPDDPTSVPVSQKFPSGWMLGLCGCWGAVSPYAAVAAPACASGVEAPRACGQPGTCNGGGAPWVRTCQ